VPIIGKRIYPVNSLREETGSSQKDVTDIKKGREEKSGEKGRKYKKNSRTGGELP